MIDPPSPASATAGVPLPDPSALAFALVDDALRSASNSAVVKRGQTYASSGAVTVTSAAPGSTPAISATVNGTEPYATEVWIHDGAVGGCCDCVHAQDGWFCKHQVALALVWRGLLSGQTPTVDDIARKQVQASAKRAQTARDREQAFKDFLHSQPASALADRLLGLADRDHEVMREDGTSPTITSILHATDAQWERARRQEAAIAGVANAPDLANRSHAYPLDWLSPAAPCSGGSPPKENHRRRRRC